MGSYVTFTPKISKLNVHLGNIQVPLSSNFPIYSVVFFKV